MTNPPNLSRHPSGRAWHPTDYLRTLYKRRWIALPAFLIVFVSGALSSLRTVPIYEARTQILIEKDSRRATTLNTVLQDRDTWYNDDFYPTQYKILQSRALAARTVAALAARKVEPRVPPAPRVSFSVSGAVAAIAAGAGKLVGWGDTPPPAPPTRPSPTDGPPDLPGVDAFLGGLVVSPIRSSLLVDLRYRSSDPEYAATAINELARQYNAMSVETRSHGSQEAKDWLEKQLETQRVALETSERRLQEFKETNKTVAVDDKQNIVDQKLSALSQEYTKARIDRVDREAALNQLQRLQQIGQVESFQAVMSNDFVQKLKTDKAALEKRRAQLAPVYLENAPPMVEVQKQLADVNGKLAAEIEKVVQSVEAEFRSAQEKEERIQRSLEQQKGEAIGVDRQQMEYAALEREAAGNRELFANLQQRTKETGVSGEYQGSNIQVIDAAEVPRSPVLPDTRRDLIMAALGGLCLGIGLAFGFEYFDSRIKLPDEIKGHLGLPFLGMIPAVTSPNPNGEAPMLSTAVSPAFSEAIRGIRTALLFSTAEEGSRSVVVTSTGPSEGKTLVSSSLAIALAQAGQRTVVVDADMRRPRMHEALGRSQEPGLSNVLVGEASLADAGRPTAVPNLWVLAAGHIPPNPAELLGSRKFDEVFAELKKRFDWIVIDAPPVMPVTDAAVLAHACGGVLFVVGSEMTPRQTAVAAIEQLRGAGARFVGAVLNRVNVHRHSYYYAPYYRKSYSKYYQRSPHQA